jgi:DNA mismatch repair ATPase MutS
MFLEQRGKCKICNKPLHYDKRSTHIDHCHTSGKVRGLLCHLCNPMLGMAQDKIETLQSAIRYLKEHQND